MNIVLSNLDSLMKMQIQSTLYLPRQVQPINSMCERTLYLRPKKSGRTMIEKKFCGLFAMYFQPSPIPKCFIISAMKILSLMSTLYKADFLLHVVRMICWDIILVFL